MKVFKYKIDKNNSGLLHKTPKEIDIKMGRWVDGNISHPMKFERVNSFSNKNVYILRNFGKDEGRPTHISLTFLQKQKFLFIQKSHWLQKEENVRYIVNVLFLIGGLIIGLLNLLNEKPHNIPTVPNKNYKEKWIWMGDWLRNGNINTCNHTFIPYEGAITTGEIDSVIITSDKALSQLKKEKDKLDLGLITQEEFDKKKKELSKFIK